MRTHLDSHRPVCRLLDQSLDLQSLRSLEQPAQHVLVDEDLAGVHVLDQAGHVLVLDVGQQHHLLRARSRLQQTCQLLNWCRKLKRKFAGLKRIRFFHSAPLKMNIKLSKYAILLTIEFLKDPYIKQTLL